jgi:hypothetical protein
MSSFVFSSKNAEKGIGLCLDHQLYSTTVFSELSISDNFYPDINSRARLQKIARQARVKGIESQV